MGYTVKLGQGKVQAGEGKEVERGRAAPEAQHDGPGL